MVVGRMDRGSALLKQALSASGLRWPESDMGAWLRTAGVVLRLWLRALRGHAELAASRPAPPPSPERERLHRQIDLCWSAGRGLISADFARGAYYSMLGGDLALEAVGPSRACRCLSATGSILRGLGVGFGERFTAAARTLAERQEEPYLLALLD